MRRVVLMGLLLAAVPAAPALAGGTGGASAPGDTFPTARAGGVAPGAGVAPVAHLSVATRAGRPRIAVRFDERGTDSVVARVVVLRSPGSAVVGRVAVGRVRVGRTVSVPWRGGALPACRYLVRVHAHDRWANQLRRLARASGRATFVVRAPSAPAAPPPSSPPSSKGVFPVAGWHAYGEGFGVDRGDHLHQGQDVAAARGTPVVAPLGGTIVTTSYQAHGAGYYVVLAATNGHAYFFAHCMQGSVAVSAGQTVVSGTGLCRVGSTGDSTGPHLHFEDWVGGWRVSSRSRPIDPLPQLRAWDH
jgi:murein DD-endopeptidase MepM/ murein hydrolase activator NlpD